MTTQPVPAFIPHPLVRLVPGQTIWTWCSKAMDREEHLYQPDKTPPLKCLCPRCNPQPHKEGEK